MSLPRIDIQAGFVALSFAEWLKGQKAFALDEKASSPTQHHYLPENHGAWPAFSVELVSIDDKALYQSVVHFDGKGFEQTPDWLLTLTDAFQNYMHDQLNLAKEILEAAERSALKDSVVQCPHIPIQTRIRPKS